MTCRPLYYKYPGQLRPQNAYIEVNDEGEIDADWDASPGNSGVPSDVWHGITMRFHISPHLTQVEIDELIEAIKPMVEELLAESAVEWDGSNYRRAFTPDGRQIYLSIMNACEDVMTQTGPCEDEDCDYCNEVES